jgi:pimeloyl-ACP methyl ester carboxylesterase
LLDTIRQITELIGFLDALQITRAIFAGHSTGAGEVVRLARLHPDRVDRLITFDIVYSGVPAELEPAFRKSDRCSSGAQGASDP